MVWGRRRTTKRPSTRAHLFALSEQPATPRGSRRPKSILRDAALLQQRADVPLQRPSARRPFEPGQVVVVDHGDMVQPPALVPTEIEDDRAIRIWRGHHRRRRSALCIVLRPHGRVAQNAPSLVDQHHLAFVAAAIRVSDTGTGTMGGSNGRDVSPRPDPEDRVMVRHQAVSVWRRWRFRDLSRP